MFSPEITHEIQQKLKEMEDKRLNYKKKIKKSWIILGVISLVIGIIVFFKNNYFPALVVIFLGLVILVIVIFVSKNGIKKRFKTNVLNPTLNGKDSGVTFDENNHITYDEFARSDLFRKNADRYNGEDLFFGERGKTAYKFSEIHAEEKHTTTNSKGQTKTTYTTIFRGIFMVADFNKKLESSTRVIQARDNFFEKLFSGKRKVSLENPEFEKKYNTYSDSQIEARYILSPAMMERILKLEELFNSRIDLSFRGNNVFIAIHSSKNHFEVDTGSALNSSQIETIYKEIDSCLRIVDVLDLNTRIWTKQ